ncbi:50S ribosomal protein L9 [Patescibacteria group bacterium]|nr:50S ribosomal protein L9 [Patescibacteria group bacterium]MBU1682555.1 50S ribosomal protein L9 [Patescibacteria group bacterium]
MKVILKTRVPNLGQEWDVVTVKSGYARNFLLPQKLAEPATASLMKKAEQVLAERAKKLEKVIAEAKETKESLANVGLTFKKKAKGKKLYGSITEKDIIEALKKEHKIEIAKEAVKMKSHIKDLGEHKVKLQLAEGVEVKIVVKVEEE